ncbi:MAG: DUF188 domain-containing protein [Turicibacter sp.]|nr:DUF188 domain-containing protein [Turicibacter sp.]
MKILIDADGCPVVDLSIRLAKKAGIGAMIFCDSSHVFEREGVPTITVMKGWDAVDFELIKYIETGDIVVTQDYGLAAMALAKEGRAISQNGLVFTPANIDQLLASRHMAQKARKAKVRLKGPAKRILEDDVAFEMALKRLLPPHNIHQ